MKIKQLSVFLENKPGQLSGPCRVLADAGINIITMSLADTQQFGILRLVVREWQKARDLLEQSGCVVKTTEVLALEVPDRPGGLADVVNVLDQNSINIEYMYAFTFGRGDQAVIVFRFEDVDAALEALRRSKVGLLDSEDLCRLSER
ncbi:MAG: ACT domain-containing protein [Kiritimatiellia bacterium]|nr:ACT domain-containing protein [Lentisphaerota bacterium]